MEADDLFITVHIGKKLMMVEAQGNFVLRIMTVDADPAAPPGKESIGFVPKSDSNDDDVM